MIDQGRRDADDAAAGSLSQHLFDCPLRQMDEAVEVGRGKLSEVFNRVVDEWLGDEDPGVVDQCIDGAEVLDRRFRYLLCCCRIAYITVDQSKAARRLYLGGLANVARRGNHIVAALDEGVDEPRAYALGGSSYQDCLVHFHVDLRWLVASPGYWPKPIH